MKKLEEIKQCILKAEDIAISTHINPDGDSVGSLLALGLGLEKLGKRVYTLSSDGVPKKYRFLPGANRIIKKINKDVDLAIAVDCCMEKTLGDSLNVFRKAKSVLEIDHHEFRRPFGDIAFVDTKAAAVGELIYILLKELKVDITPEIAQNILTSLIVETNSFRFPKTRSFTFKLCAYLLSCGVDFYNLIHTVYWSRTKEEILLSKITLERCRFIREGKIIWSLIKKKDFKDIKVEEEDADAIADEMRAIKGVEIAILFRERNRKLLRVSLRSKGDVNVGYLAEHFGGGGHFDIAGCFIKNTPKSIKEFLFSAEKLLNNC